LETILLNLGVSLLVAVVTAHLAAWLALRRFQSERWWEKKFDVYSAILRALYELSDLYSKELEGELEDPSVVPLEYQAIDKDFSQVLGLGDFIISAEAIKELQLIRQKLGRDPMLHQLYYIEGRKAIRDGLEHIRRIAKEDMKGRITLFWGLGRR
jgi:hypothetical protein